MTTNLSGAAYETLAHALVVQLQNLGGLVGYEVGYGPRNRLQGASGYKHQIDLSLLGPQHLFLIELKHFRKPVGVAELLVIAARNQDIAAARSNRAVVASLVSIKRPSRNVPQLAAFFKVKLEVVASLQSYGLSFAREHFIGHVESLSLSDTSHATLTRRQ